MNDEFVQKYSKTKNRTQVSWERFVSRKNRLKLKKKTQTNTTTSCACFKETRNTCKKTNEAKKQT